MTTTMAKNELKEGQVMEMGMRMGMGKHTDVFGKNTGAEMTAKPATYDDLLARVANNWSKIVTIAESTGLDRRCLGELAKNADVKWPHNRRSERLIKYLSMGGIDDVAAIEGFGKKKLRAILGILNEILNYTISDHSLDTEDLIGMERQNGPVFDDSPVEWVDFYWTEIQQSLVNSNLYKEDISISAKTWGLKWSATGQLTFESVLNVQSLSFLRRNRKGFGKVKIERLAVILRRAWSEAEPDGPAGPSKSPLEAVQAILKTVDLDNHEGVLTEIWKSVSLTDQEKHILTGRYGFADNKPKTLEEIGFSCNVTRERIRQIQSAAMNNIRINEISNGLLRCVLEKSLPVIADKLSGKGRRPLVRCSKMGVKRLSSMHRFIVDVLYDEPEQFLEHLESIFIAQKVDLGWWIGSPLTPQEIEIGRVARAKIEAVGKPMLIGMLKKIIDYESYDLEPCLRAFGIRVELGVCFLGRIKRPQRRCLLALQIAVKFRRCFWYEPDLYAESCDFNSRLAVSCRLLVRDVSEIPGVAVDVRGPYVAFNPEALRSAGLWAEDVGVDDKDMTLVSEKSNVVWDDVADDTLAGGVQELLGAHRIIRYDELEEAFVSAGLGPGGSLGPTLLGRPQFTRYAPGLWGLAGLELEHRDIELLSNETELKRYVIAKKTGGVLNLFSFWTPSMEYHWCRWAERNADRMLFESLLDVIDPSDWDLPEPIRQQWRDKKNRDGYYQLNPIDWNLDKAIIGFDEIYGLIQYVTSNGEIGTATIPHLYGLRDADRRSVGTLILLAVLGVVEAGHVLNETWKVGGRCDEWLNVMSMTLLEHSEDYGAMWISMLRSEIDNLNDSLQVGPFTRDDIRESFRRWEAGIDY